MTIYEIGRYAIIVVLAGICIISWREDRKYQAGKLERELLEAVELANSWSENDGGCR